MLTGLFSERQTDRKDGREEEKNLQEYGVQCLTKLKNVLQKSNSAAARGDNPLYLNNNGGQ